MANNMYREAAQDIPVFTNNFSIQQRLYFIAEKI